MFRLSIFRFDFDNRNCTEFFRLYFCNSTFDPALRERKYISKTTTWRQQNIC